MEFNPCDIKKLAELLKTDADYSSSDDDDLPRCSNKLGPGDIKQKNEIKIRIPKEESEYSTKVKQSKDPKAIWDLTEVHTVAFCDDASYDPRQRPEFDVKYRQAITSEDVFLQLGRKTPATASCEIMVIEVKLENEQKEDIDLHVTKQHLDLRSPFYRLSLPLPHSADPEASSAEWDPRHFTLTISLALNREFDFANF